MLVEVQKGSSPVILGMPHTGLALPREVAEALNEFGRPLTDTDWNIHKLYDGLLDNVSTVRATYHRYVIDANRGPSDENLYPGQNSTGLVPLTNFDGYDIWKNLPTPEQIEARRIEYHSTYHQALATEIERVKSEHGIAILYDCHSIRSEIPFLFDGLLDDLNIGTNDGSSCSRELEKIVVDICSQANGFSSVLNGRFKGGWTTRNYGSPSQGVHTIQMELAQSTHLKAEFHPFNYDAKKSENLRTLLKTILDALDHYGKSNSWYLP